MYKKGSLEQIFAAYQGTSSALMSPCLVFAILLALLPPLTACDPVSGPSAFDVTRFELPYPAPPPICEPPLGTALMSADPLTWRLDVPGVTSFTLGIIDGEITQLVDTVGEARQVAGGQLCRLQSGEIASNFFCQAVLLPGDVEARQVNIFLLIKNKASDEYEVLARISRPGESTVVGCEDGTLLSTGESSNVTTTTSGSNTNYTTSFYYVYYWY